LLAREVLRLRGTVLRSVPWDIKMDLFLYRDPEEAEAIQKKQLESAEGDLEAEAADNADEWAENVGADMMEPVGESWAAEEVTQNQ
jgi:small subunit ribosomal protein SAe